MTTHNQDPLAAHRIVSRAVAAEALDVSARTLDRMWKRGEGPSRIRLSERRVGVKLADLDAYIAGRRVTPVDLGDR